MNLWRFHSFSNSWWLDGASITSQSRWRTTWSCFLVIFFFQYFFKFFNLFWSLYSREWRSYEFMLVRLSICPSVCPSARRSVYLLPVLRGIFLLVFWETLHTNRSIETETNDRKCLPKNWQKRPTMIAKS